jgi:type IV fimbrial biogenesis protein FimT
MVMGMKSKKNTAGFTLIELMVVVTVLITLAAVAVPSFNNIIANQRIKSASYELFASLMIARSEAIKRNEDVTIASASGGWQQGWTITQGNTVIKVQPPLTKISVSRAPSSLLFRKNGRLTATSSPLFQFDIDPVNANFKRCISIELSGLPKTAKGACP